MFVLYIMELYLYKYMCKVELQPITQLTIYNTNN